MADTPIEKMMDAVEWKPLPWQENKSDDSPFATHEGNLEIGGVRLRCYQLSNGLRVFDCGDVDKFFEANLR